MPEQLDNLSNRAKSLEEKPYFRRPRRRARFVFSPDRRVQYQSENDEWRPATSGLAADELHQANRYSLGNRTLTSLLNHLPLQLFLWGTLRALRGRPFSSSFSLNSTRARLK